VRLPRGLTGQQLAKALGKLGYSVDRQTGSHIRLTTYENGEHHITVPNHSPIKVGTLNAILKGISDHFGLDRDELITGQWEVLCLVTGHQEKRTWVESKTHHVRNWLI
jgi:predicted RNA binding protein YcfA (HicA-like mRNA interferase family)